MKTEIWPDFKVERHEDYTVIWPMRFYRDEEEKKFNERIITWWRKERREGCMRYLIYICIVEVILFCGWIYYEIYFLTVS